MLMRSPDHQIQYYRERDRDLNEAIDDYTPRELLLGRLVLVLLFVVAILLYSLA